MVNGAFFVPSGDGGLSNQYAKASSVEPKSADIIDQLTLNAGVFGAPRYTPYISPIFSFNPKSFENNFFLLLNKNKVYIYSIISQISLIGLNMAYFCYIVIFTPNKV